MKVLQIDVAANVGSTGKITEQIGVKVIKNNGESTIAFGRYENISQSSKIKIGNEIEQAQHLLLTRFFDKHGLGSINGTKIFVEKIKLLNPDIIHLHQIHGYFINIEILFKFLAQIKKPVIWTLHDCWPFTGHCCHYARVECVKWQTGCYSCPLTKYYPQSLFYDNSKENYAIKKELFNGVKDITLVPVSDWLAGEVTKSFLKELPIHTIHNGVDIHKFQFTDPSSLVEKYLLTNKKVILGVASPWSDLKGLSAFVALSSMMESHIKIILIGLTESQIKGLPPNIIGITRLNNPNDLAMYYSLADVFVNPSIAESFGLVTVEAMACGTPVVGYNVTATPELVQKGTGYIVEKGDVNGLFQMINIILKNGKDLYSEACRNLVLEKYNQEIQYEKYITLYNSKIKKVS